jgi:hypothetical protein
VLVWKRREGEGTSGSTSGSVKVFFFKYLITVSWGTGGADGDWWGVARSLLLGAAIPGIVPFVMTVEALAASLEF